MLKLFVSVLLVLLLVLSLVLALAGCSGECDYCGQTDSLKTYRTKSGETLHLCELCYNMAKLVGN